MNTVTWTALSAIFAGIGVLTPFIPRIGRTPLTRVEYVVQRRQNLLNNLPGTDIKITVEGRVVQQAGVTILRIANTGRVALPTADWESPLEIRLSTGTIISSRQTAARPHGWRVPIEVRSDRLVIQPFLFNPGDLFDIQIITEGMESAPTLHARIRNVNEVSQRRPVYNLGNGPDGALDQGNKVVYFAVFPFFGLVASLIAIFTAPAGAVLSSFLVCVGVAGFYAWSLRIATVRNRKWRPAERF